MINTIESYSSNYSLYLESISYHQKQMNRYIQECICLENNNLKGLEFLNEGVIDSIKEFISNIIEKVKKAFAKIVDSFNKTFKSEQSYLESNKEIILQRKVTLEFNDYMDYDIDLFTNGSSIPKFAYSEMHSANALESEDAFIDKYLSKFRNKGGKSLYDHAVYLLQGKDPVATKQGSDINMKDLYNFCYEYDKIYKALESELDVLNKSKIESHNIITSRVAETSKPDDKEETKPEENKQEETKQESVIYSSVYNSFITESFIHELTTAGSKKDSNTAKVNTPSKPSESESVAKNQKLSTGRNDDDLSKSTASTDIDTLKKEINVYFEACSAIITAKIHIASNMHKDYMFVIREHIRSIVGTNDSKYINKPLDTPTIFTQKLNDDILSKLNQSEIEEYNQKFEAFNNEYARYWNKNSKGVQHYRTNISSQDYWTVSKNPDSDRAAVDKAIQDNENSSKIYNDLKEFLSSKGITSIPVLDPSAAKVDDADAIPEEKQKTEEKKQSRLDKILHKK